ncbi:MAG: MFS transporter [Candidatus Izemoplasma sp.]
MERLYKRNIPLDYLYTFIKNVNVTHGLWLLFLAFKGFSLFEIGIFEGVFHLTSLTMEVPTGLIADIYGRKLSRVLSILAYLIYIILMVYSADFGVIIIAFVFCGLSYTLESGAGDALVYDSLKNIGEEDKFMKVNGNKEVIYQVSSTIALFIGGYLALTNFELPFAVAFITFLVALLVIYFMKETLIEINPEQKSLKELLYDQYVSSMKIILNNKRLLYLIIIAASVAAPVTTVFLYIAFYFDELEYSRFLIGTILAGHSIFSALGGYFAYTLEKKYQEKKILYFVPLFITLSFFLIQFEISLIISFVLLGFFDSLFYVVLADYINKQTPSKNRATVFSVFGMTFSIIMIIIFPVVGYIGETVNLKFALLILAIMVGVFNIFLIVVLKRNHLNTCKK